MPDKVVETKFRAGKYMVPVTLEYEGDRIFFNFAFNRKLIDEIRNFEGRKWHGYDKNPRKVWSAPATLRNLFQIQYLQCKNLNSPENPYYYYDQPLETENYETHRPLRDYQKEMAVHILQRKMCIAAYEMGLGKTLAWIDATDHLQLEDYEVWYVGPRSGVVAVRRELRKWDAGFNPRMMTYENLTKLMKEWVPGTPAPRMVCFDESSRIKNPKAQRSEAALHLANSVRYDHGPNGYVVLMSGTPAPKQPTDWWHNCEVACPGFLKEPNEHVLKKRLCKVEERESITGGKYPHIITWYDDESKCQECGEQEDHENHEPFIRDTITLQQVPNNKFHQYVKSVNEVKKLGKRMEGLVLVGFKKDLLDLPDKQYQIIRVKPSPETIRLAKLIKATSGQAAMALNLMRELSDGFQYQSEPDGFETCRACNGEGHISGQRIKEGIDVEDPRIKVQDHFEEAIVACDACGGTGQKPLFKQGVKTIATPKDLVLKDMLEDHEEVGRFIIWGGYTATIDKLTEFCLKKNWLVLRVDGRGFHGFDNQNNKISNGVLLDCMDGSHPDRQQLMKEFPRVVVVGHPRSGGMALTLTASPSALYYSNSFDGEARMQSEDRGHRYGMDENRGYTIYDLIHLPTDQLVLDNLKQKKKLQNISMGQIEDSLDKVEESRVDYYN